MVVAPQQRFHGLDQSAMWMHQSTRQWILSSSLILLLSTVSYSAAAHDCVQGAKLAGVAKYREALQHWKTIAYDDTLKEQTQTTVTCLIESKLAASNGEVADWLTQAAEKGIGDAQAQLGWLFYAGTGVRQSTEKAIYWWKKAAQRNVTEAEITLGALYLSSNQFRDVDQGRALLNHAAQQGDTSAAKILSEYEDKQRQK